MDKYTELLETWNGKFEDLCFEIYSMLKMESETDIIDCFQFVCEKIGDIDSDESRKIDTYFTEKEIEDLKDLYGKYIDETINSVRKKVVSQKLQVKDFYHLLWQLVFQNSILISEKEKAFALLWILADNGIPFYNVGEPLSMENDEYKNILENNKESIERIKYILSVPFEQRTEVASLILQELGNKEYKVQSVLLSQALAMHSRKKLRSIKNLLSILKDEDKFE